MEDSNKKSVVKKAKKEFVFKYLASIILRLIAIIIPIIFSNAIDNATNGHFNKAYIFIAILIGVTIISRLTEIYNTYTWHKLYNKLYNNFTELGLQSTYDNSIFSLSRFNNSEFINIFNSDINIMVDYYCNFITRSVRVIEFIIILIYFFMINLVIGFVGVLISIIALTVLYLSSVKIEKVNQKKSYELDKKNNVLTEIFICIKEIKNFNIFDQIKNRGISYSANYTNAVLNQRVVEDGFKYSITLLIDLCRLALIMYGIYLISKGNMTLGTLLVIYNYYAQIIDSFSEFATFNINYRQFKVAKLRYNRLLEFRGNKNNNFKAIDIDINGEIEFKDILYGYRDNPILNKVNLEIKPNTINVITGNQKSGKTGVFDLLMKLNRQHEGEILIDNIDINDFDTDYYFNNISLVTKNPIFFNMSIRDNLSIIAEDFNKIVKVCKKLEIHEEIIKLKNGYDTIINISADELSSTVKSLLGVARILIKEPKIMLFDETFDSFDKQTKQKVIEILNETKKDHTIIIVTTDIDFLEIANQIILMDCNKNICSGTHKELIKNNDLYKNIALN